MARIFITGSTGFIGKNLQLSGFDDIFLATRETNLYRCIKTYNPDYIIHAAGEIYDEKVMFESNIKFTMKLLELTKNIPYKGFIYIGSSSEYGRKNHAMSEECFLDPTTMYEATKGAASLLCQGFARTYKKPVMVARPFSLYGEYDNKKKFLYTIIYRAIHNQTIELSKGHHDYLHIHDFIEGLKLLMSKPTIGEVYNFGSGRQHSNEEVLNMVMDILKIKPNIEHVDKIHQYDSDVWVCENSKVLGLGWKKKYTLETGLKNIVPKIVQNMGVKNKF